MTFKVELTWNEWRKHPLVQHYHWRNDYSIEQHFREEHNIHVIAFSCGNGAILAKFNSEQDYILWKLLE